MAERLMVVEDEVHLAEVIADNLELEGFEVEVVNDGTEALDRIRRRAPDLVLLDVMLPGTDVASLRARARAARCSCTDLLAQLELGRVAHFVLDFCDGLLTLHDLPTAPRLLHGVGSGAADPDHPGGR